MIKSFRCKDTEQLSLTGTNAKFAQLRSAGVRKLDLLNGGVVLSDLKSPGNQLEDLTRDRKGSTQSESAGNIDSASNGRMGMLTRSKSLTIIEKMKPSDEKFLAQIHPGRTIKEDYIDPLNISINSLAIALGVPANRMNEIVRGKRGITADTALRLGRYFGTTPDFWMNIQTAWELRAARCASGKAIEKNIKPLLDTVSV